jgi:hypothetical protein
LRAVREQIAEFKLAEAREREVESAELQFAELEAEGVRGPNPRLALAGCRRGGKPGSALASTRAPSWSARR